MKKIIPLIAVVSLGAVLTGCSNNITEINSNNITDNINQFEKNIKACNITSASNLTTKYLNKYNVSLEPLNELDKTEYSEIQLDDKSNDNIAISPLEPTMMEENITTLEEIENNEVYDENTEEISTLYSLKYDI